LQTLEQVSVPRESFRPDDGGSKDLWNVGKLIPDNTVLQPRIQPSLKSPPWEPQILLRCARCGMILWTQTLVLESENEARCSFLFLLHFCIIRADDGGSKDPWNDGKPLPDYTELQPSPSLSC
jgi:hypothetical protein